MRGRPRPRGGCWNCRTSDSRVSTSRWNRTVVTCCPVTLASCWASRGSLAPRRIASRRRRGQESDIAHPSSRETLSDVAATYSLIHPIHDVQPVAVRIRPYHRSGTVDHRLSRVKDQLPCPSLRTLILRSALTHTLTDW